MKRQKDLLRRKMKETQWRKRLLKGLYMWKESKSYREKGIEKGEMKETK